MCGGSQARKSTTRFLRVSHSFPVVCNLIVNALDFQSQV